MFSLARTEYVVPRVTFATTATNISLHRVLVGVANVGVLLNPKQTVQASATYSIFSSIANGQNTNSASSGCLKGGVSMFGKWNLQGEQDGFYGLQNGNSFLSNRAALSTREIGIGLSQALTDAGQRWIIRSAGDGFFNIINRASGEALTSDLDGCATLCPPNGASTQEWVVDLAEPENAAAN
jgi:hypothetical protein